MKAALAALALLVASPAGAGCFCLKCATGAWESFQPVSGSMKPAIEPGACVTVQKGAPVDRGSIIAVLHPTDPGTYMLKRLIGLPEDVIELRSGRVILNGITLLQVPSTPYDQLSGPEGPEGIPARCPTTVADGEICTIPRFTETLPNGLAYDVLDLYPESGFDNRGPFTVPANHIFVIGDNRDNSNDSRFPQEVGGLGMIPAANILGPAVEIANP